MVAYDGEYKLESSENFDEYMKAVGKMVVLRCRRPSICGLLLIVAACFQAKDKLDIAGHAYSTLQWISCNFSLVTYHIRYANESSKRQLFNRTF